MNDDEQGMSSEEIVDLAQGMLELRQEQQEFSAAEGGVTEKLEAFWLPLFEALKVEVAQTGHIDFGRTLGMKLEPLVKKIAELSQKKAALELLGEKEYKERFSAINDHLGPIASMIEDSGNPLTPATRKTLSDNLAAFEVAIRDKYGIEIDRGKIIKADFGKEDA